MKRGYIKVWRKIEDSGLIQLPKTLSLFMFILLNATHKERKLGTPTGVINLMRGQYVSGRIELAKRLKQSEQEIRTSLARLEQLDIITINSTNKYSTYTIVNYDIYQDDHQPLNQQITNKQPADNQQITTKQECNTVNMEECILKPLSDFDKFWFNYPKKVGKEAARKAWNKTKPNFIAIVDALEWQIKSEQWNKQNGQFVPNPATYLNEGRWQDEKPKDGFVEWAHGRPNRVALT